MAILGRPLVFLAPVELVSSEPTVHRTSPSGNAVEHFFEPLALAAVRWFLTAASACGSMRSALCDDLIVYTETFCSETKCLKVRFVSGVLGQAMRKNALVVWHLLIATMFIAMVGCGAVRHVEKRTLTATESKRQIELLKEIRPDEIEGKQVSDFSELFSLADVICSENGQIVSYIFHRKGEGGNDDGSDSAALIIVENGVVQSFSFIIVPS